PVELVDAAGDSRRIVDVSGKRGQCHWPTLAWTAQALRPGADAAGGTLLDQRVPLAAGIALAGPARMHRSAALADELDAGFSHGPHPAHKRDGTDARGSSAARRRSCPPRARPRRSEC